MMVISSCCGAPATNASASCIKQSIISIAGRRQQSLTDAIKRLSLRAQKVAESFGRKGYTLVNVTIDNHASMPPPVVFSGRAMAMKAEVASPTIDAGTQEVEVTVNGAIELTQ